MNDILTVSLEIPNPWQPRYEVWKKELERFELTPDTLLIGHSCGGGFLVRYLSENQHVHVGKVILVAPWMNPDNNQHSDTADFFVFEMDKKLASRTRGLTVFSSIDDSSDVLKTVDLIRQNIEGAQFREFSGKGHFTIGDLGTAEFPELAEECLK